MLSINYILCYFHSVLQIKMELHLGQLTLIIKKKNSKNLISFFGFLLLLKNHFSRCKSNIKRYQG